MISLEKEIENVKKELQNFEKLLDNFNLNNFAKDFDILNSELEKIKKQRNDLIKKYPKNEIEGFNKELDVFIKQINSKFDNVLLKIKKEQKEISSKLQNGLNKKKLSTYR